MDRIDLFRIFVRVVDSGSFTRAADSLRQPRSTVSAAIQQLERRLGTVLINRTTRRLAVTRDGSTFYERCLRLIADVEETELLFRQSVPPTGKVRVDVPGRIGRLIIAPALPDFLDAHPRLDVDLQVTDRAVDLIEHGVDCALRVGTLADSSLIARRLGELTLINVASPAYLARHGVPTAPDHLATHQAVHYASPSTGRIEDWEWMDQGRAHTCAMAGRVTVNSAEAYIACCLAGLGLIQIPAYDVRDHLASGALVELMPGHRAAPMPMTLLYPGRRALSRRVQLFSDWLQVLLKQQLLTA